MKSRLISILFALALLCTLLPQVTLLAQAEVYTGICGAEGEGNNLNWMMDTDTGVLTINGSGAMEDYPEGWSTFKEQITKVILPEGLTRIGYEAFDSCTALQKITIPATVTEIGDYAFYGCGSLTQITIPDSMVQLGIQAFSNCTALEQVTLGSGLQLIHYNVFYNTAFFNNPNNWTGGLLCLGEWLIQAEKTIQFASLPGIKHLANGAFGGCSTLTDVILPDELTVIPDGAFADCRSLAQIHIPAGITEIGISAFCKCAALEEISLPDSVTSIGGGAFAGCVSLKALSVPAGVRNIPAEAFFDCRALKSLELQEGVETISYAAFNNCTALPSVTIPDSVKELGAYAFGACNALADVTFGAGLERIGAFAFQGTGITALQLPDKLSYIEQSTFADCASLQSVRLPDGLTAIGIDAFRNCIRLEDISLPDGLTAIGPCAFYGCKAVAEIFIPAATAEIAPGAFADCKSLIFISVSEDNPAFCAVSGVLMDKAQTTLLQYPAGKSGNFTFPQTVTDIEDAAFLGSSISEVDIPNSTNRIGSHAFYNCSSLHEVELPASLSFIGEKAFGFFYNPEQQLDAQVDGFLIRGHSGSLAQSYAKSNRFAFQNLTPCVFTDVPENAYYRNAVIWASETGVTHGTGVTTFSPNAGCTRSQVVTFLWRAAGSPEPETTNNPFKDVAAGAWYYKAVLWASETGVTAGTSATTFSPNQTCTRGQIVTFIWRYEGSPEATTTNNPFADVPDGTWYTKAVLWASETGVTAGTSATTFSPNATCTRAQIVTFLYRDILQ